MLDGVVRRAIDPTLDKIGGALARAGVGANTVTLIGLALGVAAAAMISFGVGALALVPLLAGRLADGLDGAVARATRKTDFGGYLDIVCDFLFYGMIPLAFIIHDPAANSIAGAALLTSFYVNGASFLGYAILAERRGMSTTTRGEKSLYFTSGLLEGTETIAFFVVLCLWPTAFAPLAFGFALLCFLTTISRILLAWRVFGKPALPPAP